MFGTDLGVDISSRSSDQLVKRWTKSEEQVTSWRCCYSVSVIRFGILAMGDLMPYEQGNADSSSDLPWCDVRQLSPQLAHGHCAYESLGLALNTTAGTVVVVVTVLLTLSVWQHNIIQVLYHYRLGKLEGKPSGSHARRHSENKRYRGGLGWLPTCRRHRRLRQHKLSSAHNFELSIASRNWPYANDRLILAHLHKIELLTWAHETEGTLW